MSDHTQHTDHLPTAPCAMMTPEADRRLTSMEKMLGEITVALIGNKELGQKGLVTRVEAVEQLAERHDRKLLAWGAIVSSAVVAAQFLQEKILGK